MASMRRRPLPYMTWAHNFQGSCSRAKTERTSSLVMTTGGRPLDIHDVASKDTGGGDGLPELPIGDGGRAAEGIEPFPGAPGGMVATGFGP